MYYSLVDMEFATMNALVTVLIVMIIIFFVLATILARPCSSDEMEDWIRLELASRRRSAIDEIAEIKAQIELEENYVYKKPNFAGWYLGEKIKNGDPRLQELWIDDKFVRAQGKWVRRKK